MRGRVAAWALWIGICVTAAVLAGLALYMRRGVPPDCRDPRTLSLVRKSLVRSGLPASARMTGIRTIAGGPLAFQFVCEGKLENVADATLADGGIPGMVRYTSTLTHDRAAQEVTVKVLPLLRWEQVF